MFDLNVCLILCVATFVAAVIQGVSGFAFALILLMVLPYIFPYAEALALIAFIGAVMIGYNVYLYRKYIDWKILPIPVLSYFVCDLLAVRLLKNIGTNPMLSKILGVIFILLAVYLCFGQGKIKVLPTKKNAVIFNGVGGAVSGLFGAGGPIAVLYFMAVSASKEVYMGTLQTFLFLVTGADFFVRVANGMVTLQTVKYGLSSLIFAVVGLWIAKKLFEKIKPDVLNKIVLALMALNGIWLVIA